MTLGPGKYDDLCTEVRERSGARCAIVIIFEGTHGPGFSCQGDILSLAKLPRVLRFLADQIERDAQEGLQ